MKGMIAGDDRGPDHEALPRSGSSTFWLLELQLPSRQLRPRLGSRSPRGHREGRHQNHHRPPHSDDEIHLIERADEDEDQV